MGKVRGNYRSNYLKDLKQREKARGRGTKEAVYPFLQSGSPFTANQQDVPAPMSEKEDLLAAIEMDPRAQGKTEQ
jgi:hypothetical protein